MSPSASAPPASGPSGAGEGPSARKKKKKPVDMNVCIDTGDQRSCSSLADEAARFDCLAMAVNCCLDATQLEMAMSCLATYYPYGAEGDAPNG